MTQRLFQTRKTPLLSSKPLSSGSSLLPFVDILFSTVGIFIIILTIYSIPSTIATLPSFSTDAVVVCETDLKYVLITPSNPYGLSYSHEELQSGLKRIAEHAPGEISIILVVTENTFAEKKLIEDSINTLNAGNTQKAFLQRPPISVMIWPMSIVTRELPPIVQTWMSQLNGSEYKR